MTERETYIALTAVIRATLTAAGFAGVEVRQGFQPRIVGTPTGPAVFISALSTVGYGWVARQDSTVPLGSPETVMVHTETQRYESTYQINAQYPQNPKDPTRRSARDLLAEAWAGLQSDAGRAALRSAGFGVLRVTQSRALPVQMDQDEFQYVPSFDVTVTYETARTSTTPHTADIRATGIIAI